MSSDLGDIYGNTNPEVIIHLLLQKVFLLVVDDRRHWRICLPEGIPRVACSFVNGFFPSSPITWPTQNGYPFASLII